MLRNIRFIRANGGHLELRVLLVVHGRGLATTRPHCVQSEKEKTCIMGNIHKEPKAYLKRAALVTSHQMCVGVESMKALIMESV